MLLKRYKSFIIEKTDPKTGIILPDIPGEPDSILFIDQILRDVFQEIFDHNRNNVAARSVFILLTKFIFTSCNYLRIGEKNDEILFLPSNKLEDGEKTNRVEYNFKRSNQASKIGRIFKKLFTENKIDVSDKDLEDFVNWYKKVWETRFGNNKFIIVKGEDIRKWYLNNIYCRKTLDSLGSLGKSCMSHKQTQKFLNIYVDNPEVCNLITQYDMDGKLTARALLWTLVDGTHYLDRVYYTYDYQYRLMIDWFIKNYNPKIDRYGFNFSHDKNSVSPKIEIKLKKWKYNKYPFMDSFYTLDYKNGIISNKDIIYSSEGEKIPFIRIHSTDGIPSSYYWVWSNPESRWIPKKEAVRDGDGEWISKLLYSPFLSKIRRKLRLPITKQYY